MILYFLTKGIAIKSEKNVITNSKAEVIFIDTILCCFNVSLAQIRRTELYMVYGT